MDSGPWGCKKPYTVSLSLSLSKIRGRVFLAKGSKNSRFRLCWPSRPIPTHICSAYSTWTICDNWVGQSSVKPDLSKQCSRPDSCAVEPSLLRFQHCPDSCLGSPPLPLPPIPCVCIPTSSINSPYSSWPRSKVRSAHESCASKAALSGSHNTLSLSLGVPITSAL